MSRSAAASLSGVSSRSDTIRGTRPPTQERNVHAVDENDFINREKVESVRPQARARFEFDDYFVSRP